MIGRTNCGAGGGVSFEDAIIRVEANSGSVVTATNGTKTLTAEEVSVTGYNFGFFYFSIKPQDFGTWTITCVSSGQTLTKTVSVSAPFEYVRSFVRLYLYSHGDEFSSITGGWGGYAQSKEGTNAWTRFAPTVTNYSDYLSVIFNPTSTYRTGWARINSAVDISSFTKLCIEYDVVTSSSKFDSSITGADTPSNHYTSSKTIGLSKGTGLTAEEDITSVRSSQLYWGIDMHDASATTTEIKIYSMWFE